MSELRFDPPVSAVRIVDALAAIPGMIGVPADATGDPLLGPPDAAALFLVLLDDDGGVTVSVPDDVDVDALRAELAALPTDDPAPPPTQSARIAQALEAVAADPALSAATRDAIANVIRERG